MFLVNNVGMNIASYDSIGKLTPPNFKYELVCMNKNRILPLYSRGPKYKITLFQGPMDELTWLVMLWSNLLVPKACGNGGKINILNHWHWLNLLVNGCQEIEVC